MIKIFHGKRSSRFRQIMYHTAIVALISLSIYQVYSIRANLSDSTQDMNVLQNVVSDESSTVLTPHEIFLTTGNDNGYVKVEATSGYYPELCKQIHVFLEEAVQNDEAFYKIEETELPVDAALMVLRYAYTIEHTALQEMLSLKVDENMGFQEIWIQPAVSEQEGAVLYFINWQQGFYMQMKSTMTWKNAVNQDLCAAFYTVTDAVDAEYWAAWRRFPETFQGGVYYMQQESELIVYEAALETSYGSAESYNLRDAEKYIKHFFPYPDTAKSIGESDTTLWYADEKRTVRLEPDGFLQYVQTPERSKDISVTLEQAYQTAAAFLKEDLACDTTRLLEVYLCEYAIQDGEYTFYWNYKLDNIPLWMDPDRQENWDLRYPVKITVENGIVRYYHRYLIHKEMQSDQLYRVPVSYMEAVDTCRKLGGIGPVQSMDLGYIESANQLELCWMLKMDDQWYKVPMEGDGL